MQDGALVIAVAAVLFVVISLAFPSQGSRNGFADAYGMQPRAGAVATPGQGGTKSLDRTDVLVFIVTLSALATAVGSIFDIWQAVYYTIPVLTVVFMLLGALSSADRWHAPNVALIGAFSAVLIGLFIAAEAVIGSGTMMGGLPLTTAIFVYFVWPWTAIGGPLVYAAVHSSWLLRDLNAEVSEPARQSV